MLRQAVKKARAVAHKLVFAPTNLAAKKGRRIHPTRRRWTRGADKFDHGSHRQQSSAAKTDPFTRQQKEKLLQLRDAMVDSMAGVAQDTLRLARKAAKHPLSACTRPMPAPMRMIAISR